MQKWRTRSTSKTRLNAHACTSKHAKTCKPAGAAALKRGMCSRKDQAAMLERQSRDGSEQRKLTNSKLRFHPAASLHRTQIRLLLLPCSFYFSNRTSVSMWMTDSCQECSSAQISCSDMHAAGKHLLWILC